MKPFSEHILRCHVWAAATIAPLLVRLCSMRTLLRLATPRRPWKLYANVPPERICHIVRKRLAHPTMMRRRSCLRLALTTFHFLRLSGAAAEFNIGAWPPSHHQRRLRTHCWVTLDGRAVETDSPVPPGILLRH